MSTTITRLCFCGIVWCAALAGAAPPFLHPGMLQNREDLEFLKRKVLAGEQPWKGAYDRMCRGSVSALSFEPKPAAHVIRGAYGNPSIGSNELLASARAAESHALQWYVTGDKAHARKVIEIFNAWSPVLRDFQQNDAKLLAGWTGHQFLNAAEIIRYTDAGWEAKDVGQFKAMILGVYYPLIKDFYPEANGNWDAAIMDTMLCIGVFCDDRAIFDRAVEHYLRGHLNGGITHYVYPSGQCQESTRDQAHTQLGLGEMAQACRVAWTQGVDLFGAADDRLALGFEYTAKYMLGEEVPCDGVISPTGRGKFSDIYYLVYDHYHFEKGLALPYTAKAVEQTAERSQSVLTMYKGPRTPGARAEGRSPSLPGALRSGALPRPSGEPPKGAVVVEAGQSVQAALDRLGKDGGWVVLDKGVHTLPAALRVPSRTTLTGQGDATIVMLDAGLTGPAVVNADDAAHDVVVRDLVIEGATTTKLPSDLNTGRRTRSRPGAPKRAGIIFGARTERPLRDIRLERVTVGNCTMSGVEIDNAASVTVRACNFTDNGNDGGSDTLVLRRVVGCRIESNCLNNSPAGAGLRVFGGRAIVVGGNEVARNRGAGVVATDVLDLEARGNLFEGNEDGGFRLDAVRTGCEKFELRANVIRNNGGYAIDVRRANGGHVSDNRTVDNAQPEPIRLTESQGVGQ